MNRRSFFSFLAAAPVGVVAAKPLPTPSSMPEYLFVDRDIVFPKGLEITLLSSASAGTLMLFDKAKVDQHFARTILGEDDA